MSHKSGIRKGVTNLDTKVSHKVCRNAGIRKCHNAGIHKCHNGGYTSVTMGDTQVSQWGIHKCHKAGIHKWHKVLQSVDTKVHTSHKTGLQTPLLPTMCDDCREGTVGASLLTPVVTIVERGLWAPPYSLLL